MEFTASQLKAIEDAIGRDATVKMRLDRSHEWERFHSETIIEVRCTHKGERLVSYISLHPYMAAPFRVLAEQLVMRVNHEIMNKEFKGAFKR